MGKKKLLGCYSCGFTPNISEYRPGEWVVFCRNFLSCHSNIVAVDDSEIDVSLFWNELQEKGREK